MRFHRLLLAASLSLGPLCLIQASELDLQLQQLLENHPSEMSFAGWHQISVTEENRWLAAVYHDSGFTAYWIGENGPEEKAKILLETIQRADLEGLETLDYDLAAIEQLWTSKNPQDLARLEVMLTVAYIEYMSDVRYGRVQPKKEDEAIYYHGADRDIDAIVLITEARDTPDFADFLAQQLPKHEMYRLTKVGLQRYKNISAAGGWSVIAQGETIHPGEQDERLPQIRQRLMISGDLSIEAANSSNPETNPHAYDDQVFDGVKKFQLRHGLTPDGVLGKGTIAAMNVPADYRVKQIAINLERWRWMDHDLGERYIVADIPSYTVTDYQDDKVSFEMPVIVGKSHHETPVFSEDIKYVVINPYWTLTPSIARNETLGKLRKDSHYLKKNHISLFRGWNDPHELDATKINWHRVSAKEMNKYRFRQNPGPWNALGVLKIVFPNKHSVYMHDTPNHKLFKREVRGFSHGCIRMSDPVRQASIVLGDKWPEERINEVIASGKRTVVHLEQPMKVHLAYQTAWGDEKGGMHFVKDIYNRDVRLLKALYH